MILALLLGFAISAQVKVTNDGGVVKDIITEGSGPSPKQGQKVDVHYVGTLPDGKKFDSSRDRNRVFTFTIGQGVIQGWSLGVATMKVGEKAKFILAPEYAYGDRGAPPVIPPKATLHFEIELLKIH